MKLRKKIEGFTLIELMVVMSIIAFLLLASLAGLTYGLKKARDTSRQRAIATLQTALLAYYNDNLEFPHSGTSGLNCGQTVTGSDGNTYTRCDVTSLTGLNETGSAQADNPEQAPLYQYFEEGFRSPIAISGGKDLDNAMAYYVNDDGSKYAICTLTEIASSGNVQDIAQQFQDNKWGCYCDGPLGSIIKCAGLINPTGNSQ